MKAPRKGRCPDTILEACPACGAVGMELVWLHWSGRDAKGGRTGGVIETFRCPGCDRRFRRGTDGGLVPLHPPAR